MTPYTSFLVLESDADRERFGVKRRFRMRDGEKFFAEGRDQATLELLQKQIKQAGAWRQNLRRQIMKQLSMMGKGVRISQVQRYGAYAPGSGAKGSPAGNTYRGKSKKMDIHYLDASEEMEFEGLSKQPESREEVSFEEMPDETSSDNSDEDLKEMPEPSTPLPAADPMPMPAKRKSPEQLEYAQELYDEARDIQSGERDARYEKLIYSQNAIVGLDMDRKDLGASEGSAYYTSRTSPYSSWNLYQFFPNLLPPQNLYAPKEHT